MRQYFFDRNIAYSRWLGYGLATIEIVVLAGLAAMFLYHAAASWVTGFQVAAVTAVQSTPLPTATAMPDATGGMALIQNAVDMISGSVLPLLQPLLAIAVFAAIASKVIKSVGD